jgi:hypothetical protein
MGGPYTRVPHRLKREAEGAGDLLNASSRVASA